MSPWKRLTWPGKTPRPRGATGIQALHHSFDPRGFLAAVAFYGGREDQPRADERGAYGYLYENGRLGRWTRATALAADGKPIALVPTGEATWEREDDDTPEGKNERYYDADRQPMLPLDFVSGA